MTKKEKSGSRMVKRRTLKDPNKYNNGKKLEDKNKTSVLRFLIEPKKRLQNNKVYIEIVIVFESKDS